MSRLFLSILSLIIVLIGREAHVFAQSQANIGVEGSSLEKLGKVVSLQELATKPSTDRAKKALWKSSIQRPVNFRDRASFKPPKHFEGLPSGADPAIQIGGYKRAVDPKILVNETVHVDGFGSPYDPSGDVGLNYYINAVNITSIAIYNKDGSLALPPFASNTFWNEVNRTAGGDPIILFDQVENRWIITEFPTTQNELLIAVSVTSDPLGDWYIYRFGTPAFPDYPKYALWNDALVVTTNEQGNGVLTGYFINKNELYTGLANVANQRVSLPGISSGPGFMVATPVDMDGKLPTDSKPMMMHIHDDAWGGTAEDKLSLYEFDIDWTNPDNTSAVLYDIPLAAFDTDGCAENGPGFACAPQPNGATGLDAILGVVMNQVHYRNFGTHEGIVLNFMVDADGTDRAGIRWVELRKTTSSEWSVYQEGTFAPNDDLHRYMGATAYDRFGNIALVYNSSSYDDFVDIRMTARSVNDQLGVMSVKELVLAEGTNIIDSRGRFGDYAHMTIDPTDETTFWYTGEYAGDNNSNSAVKAISFILNQEENDMSANIVESPITSAELSDLEAVTVQFTNQGLQTARDFTVYAYINGELLDQALINVALETGESYSHTFETLADLSAVGAYEVMGVVLYDEDTYALNDTVRKIIHHLPEIDAGISGDVQPFHNGCYESTNIPIVLTNEGAETLTSIAFSIMHNGQPSSYRWTGSLAYEASEIVNVPVTMSTEGEQTIQINIETVNGAAQDDNELNNELTGSFDYSLAGSGFTLLFTTDEYPAENSWELRDFDNNLIATNGELIPFTEHVTTFCLQKEQCYRLTVFDTWGDGMCCEYGDGQYTILNENGEVVLFGNGQFNSSISHEFCADRTCLLSIDVAITEVSASNDDGVIAITASNGSAPYVYSIDGGNTFQNSNVFEGLESTTYDVVVRDALLCEVTEVVNMAPVSVDGALLNEVMLDASPNPTDGLAQLTLSGLSFNQSIGWQLLDNTGRVLQHGRMDRYGGAFKTEISLYALPQGMYYFKVEHPMVSKVLPIVRQ